jgi:hypothetical protein
MSLKNRLLKLEAIIRTKDKREIVAYSVRTIDNITNRSGYTFKVVK